MAEQNQMGAASGQLSYPSTIIDEDDELKRKIVLYYHTLFQGALSQWFVLLQQKNYKKLGKDQYVDLNVRIQKSLILDFDEQAARESAEQDWKIDLDREVQEKKSAKMNGSGLEQIPEDQDKEEDQSSSEGFDDDDE